MSLPPSIARGRGRVGLLAILGLLLLASTLSPAMAANATAPGTPASVSFDPERQVLTVSTVDKQWALELTPKRLFGNISELQAAMQGLPQFYNGRLGGDTDSWVRIAEEDIADGVYTGHVFTGGALYELQYHEDMGGHALALMPGGLTLGDMVLPEAPRFDDDRDADGNEPVEAGNSLLPGNLAKAFDVDSDLAPRAIRIGIAVDSSYNEHYDQRGLAHALSIINGVDGLYQEQLGMAVIVDGFRVYDDPEQDPLRDYPGDVDQTLGRYRDLRMADEELPAELALVHLFSGHPDPNKVIGLGWIDTVCRLDGYDLSLSTPFPYDMLLAAHEIAHNLGAVHDDDAACNTDESISGSEIMWSELSNSTRPAFSACSLNKMRPALTASCVLDNIDVGIEIAAVSTGLPDQLAFSVSAYNNDSDRVAPQVSSTTEFPAGTRLLQPSAGCSINETQLICRHSVLQPGGSANTRSVIAEFMNDGATYPVVSSQLAHGGFTDTEQLDNRATLQLDDPRFGLNNVTFADAGNYPSALPASEGDMGVPENDQPSIPTGAMMTGGSAGAGSAGPLGLLIMGFFGLAAGRRPRIQKLRSTE